MADSVKSQVKKMKSGAVLRIIVPVGFKDCTIELLKDEGCQVLEVLKEAGNTHIKARIK